MVGSTRMQKSLHDGNRSFKLFLPAMPPTSPSPFLKFITTHQWKLAAALLVLYYLSAVTATLQKSATFDEVSHLTLGYLLWTDAGTPHVATNGILAQRLAALPLVVMGVHFPDLQQEPYKHMDQFWVGRTFFYNSGNALGLMLLLARSMSALLGVGAALVVFHWSRRLFGVVGAMISLTLFVFCPNMLANGPLITADMAAAFGFTVATYTFWELTHRITPVRLLLSVTALGLLVLGKLSCILIGPIFVLILALRLVSSVPVVLEWKQTRKLTSPQDKAIALAAIMGVHAVGILLLLWLFYNFVYANAGGNAALSAALQSPDFSWLSLDGCKYGVMDLISKCGIFPPAFVEGINGTLLATSRAPGFLSGRYTVEGWWWFFPYSLLVKTPLASLLLLLAAFGAWFTTRSRTHNKKQKTETGIPSLYDLAPLFILIGVYLLASLSTKMNIGHRHILPLYPPLYVLAGLNVYWMGRKNWSRLIPLFLLAGLIFESLAVRPHYLAFFNASIGGPQQGYRHLVDSSLDWGQDLPGLKKWLDAHVEPGKEKIYLSYFGTALPEHYGILAEPLPCHFDWTPRKQFPLEAGVYCLSATMLESVYSPLIGPWCVAYENLYQRAVSETQRWEQTAGNADARRRLVTEQGAAYWEQVLEAYRQARFSRLCAYLRQREPDAEVGYSILIYRLTTEDLKKALGPGPAELLSNRVPLFRNAPLPD